MKSYDERTTERVWLTSDRRVVVGDNDPKARYLLHGHSVVTRAAAQEIRGYKDGESFLEPVPGAVVPPDEVAPEAAPIADSTAATGPDMILDYGRKYRGKKYSELPDKYLAKTLLKKAEYKAAAEAEIARRARNQEENVKTGQDQDQKPGEAIKYGPEDEIDFGTYKGTKVKDLPLEFIEKLSAGATEVHGPWCAAEMKRREDAAA